MFFCVQQRTAYDMRISDWSSDVCSSDLFSAPGRKERAGLGVVPTRLADCGPLWKRPLDHAGLHWRLESLHRPYHAALAAELAAARERFGRAVLIDLHSLPGIPPGQIGRAS